MTTLLVVATRCAPPVPISSSGTATTSVSAYEHAAAGGGAAEMRSLAGDRLATSSPTNNATA